MTSFKDKIAFVQKFAPKSNDKIQKILKLSANIDSPKLNDTQREQIKKALETAYDKLKQLKEQSAAKKTPKSPRQTTKRGKKSAGVDDSQKVLNDFKKSVGTALYKKATSRTTIKKDKEIPALKEGKRYPKAGKTTNQYGTFKNQTKRPYWESRANRMDVNQPSKKRYPKLADGGSVANQFYFYDYDGNAITFRDFEQARLEAKERGIQKFRDNLGGEYFVNYGDGGTLAKAERDAKRLSKTYGKIYVLKREAGGEEGKYVTATEEDLFEELNSPYKSTFVSFFGKGKKYGDGGQTINLGSGEMTLDEAIDMYEKKIKAQGNVSNERDENMLRQLKQMKKEFAKGGLTEHGLKKGDTITDDMSWEDSIVVKNEKSGTRAKVNLNTGKRMEAKMADGGKMEDCGCDEYADGGMFDENELEQARKATGKLKL